MSKRVKVILKSIVLIGVLVFLYWATFHLPESPYDYELSEDLMITQDDTIAAYKFSSIYIYQSVYEPNWPWLPPEELEKLPVVYKTHEGKEIIGFMDSMRKISYERFDGAGDDERELLYILISMLDGRKAFYGIMLNRKLGVIDVRIFPRPEFSIGSEGYSSVEFYKFLMEPGRLG